MALLPVPVEQFIPEEKPTPFAQFSRKPWVENDFTDWHKKKPDFSYFSQRPTASRPQVAPRIRIFPDWAVETSSVLVKHQTNLEKSPAELQQVFSQLVEKWHDETGHLSSTLHKVTHPAYQRIIGLGPYALPLILRELQSRPNFWFWALKAISGEDPAQDKNSIEDATEAWLQWGIERGIISSDK